MLSTMTSLKRPLLAWVLTAFFALLFAPLVAFASNHVIVVKLEGAIGPVSQDLVLRSLKQAEDQGAALVVLEMNTPGGLDSSMRAIVSAILASKIPVATYVHPAGSRAASAGTYILYASHIAAMTPATNLGSATPVQIGGIPGLPDNSPAKPAHDETPDAPKPADAMGKKVLNDAVAYIRGLAELRGRNADWAEQAVRDALNLTASAALEQQVIDIVAEDLADLLRQLDGREVTTAVGKTVLKTANATLERIEPDWRSELLAMITNPSIALLLMMVGIYGLILEFSNPGAILPGVTGAIALLLGMYALQMLPVNYVGLALLVIGVGFMIAEMFAGSGGILGVGGLLAFVLGAIFLFDHEHLAISLPLIGGIALIAGGFLLWTLRHFARLRHKPVVSGLTHMIGQSGKAAETFSGSGHVYVNGEYWQAYSDAPVQAGQAISVIAAHDMILHVTAKETN